MKKENSEKRIILSGAEGGLGFTLATFVPLLLAVLFLIIVNVLGYKTEEIQNSNVYIFCNYAITPIGLAIAVGMVFKRADVSFVSGARLNRFELKYVWIAVLIAFGSIFGLGWINDLFIDFLKKLIGFEGTPVIVPKGNFGVYLMCVLTICLMPAFMEELTFRGVILNSVGYMGNAFAVLVSGALFSLYHKNPMQTPYQFIMGMLFCLLVIKSGSIFPSIILHFLNNFYIITAYYIMPDGYEFSTTANIILLVLGLIVLAFAVWYLIFKCETPEHEKKLCENYRKLADIKGEKVNFALFAFLGIAACVVLWVSQLFTLG